MTLTASPSGAQAPVRTLISVLPDDEATQVIVGRDVDETDRPPGSWPLVLLAGPQEIFTTSPAPAPVTVFGWRWGWPSEPLISHQVASSAEAAIDEACLIFNISSDFVPAVVLCGWY